ncbi:hypothetical protein [Corallococcus caeni]|uniref:(Fe-S)-binding protein n=1 Tax=Corallococcus caeni TaxID=3082388 RepID=A0ABQ6R3M5_9BACT|nr:hypothetical protein ASNO1_70800 [Corallococcus sp. NO1]
MFQACGERVILPKVRGASGDTLLITDGFSCREQIRQATGRKPPHLAQVLQKALRRGEVVPRSATARPGLLEGVKDPHAEHGSDWSHGRPLGGGR